MKLRFRLEGHEYDYDGEMSVKDAIFIYKESGVGVAQLNDALIREGNPTVVAPFMYLLMRREGMAIQYKDVLEMNIASFNFEPIDETVATDDQDEDDGGQEAGEPGKSGSRSGKTRKSAT